LILEPRNKKTIFLSIKTMIARSHAVEPLIQAPDTREAGFCGIVERLGALDKPARALLFEEGVRVQGTDPERVRQRMKVLDRL
jgi:hypothetical protein